MKEQQDRRYLELPEGHDWPECADKTRILFAAFNVPGYYSLPVRLLSLVVEESPDLAGIYETRYAEWEFDDDIRGDFSRTGPTRGALEAARRVVDTIAGWKPDIVGFSVNIWNRNVVFTVAEVLKNTMPKVSILAGGQEMSGSTVDYLASVPALDYVVDGEGEIPLRQFLRQWDTSSRSLRDPGAVSGLRYRRDGVSQCTGPAECVGSLDEVPSVILAGLVPPRAKGKLGVLLEGTRGCPFRCSFCFEGGRGCKVRTTSVDRLREEVFHMSDLGARSFHMMDPILCSSRPERLRQIRDIFSEVCARHPRTMISVEAYGDQISDEVAECLGQFTMVDVGLQTINPETVKAIHRVYDTGKFVAGVDRLRRTKATFNLYLISGLPHETMATFLKGVEFVVSLRPTRIFLNELCLLNGTELRQRADEFGYVFDQDPPYKMVSNKWMTSRETALIHSLSTPFSLRYNLSASSISHMMPWAAGNQQAPAGPVSVAIGGPCETKCQGCQLADSGPRLSGCGDIMQRVAGRDVELYAGNRCAIDDVLRVAAELNFGGASRIRLTAPLDFFNSGETVHKLVNAGAWHFRSWFDLRHDPPPQPWTYEPFVTWKKQLEMMGRPMRLPRWGEVRPFVEMVLLTGTRDIASWWNMVRITADAAGIISLPGARSAEFMLNGCVPWEDDLRGNCWLRLPMESMRRVLGTSESSEEALKSLDRLGLLCNEEERPPCFVTAETQGIGNR